jgi:hypothetical protein
VGGRAIVITYLNSGWRNTQETRIIFHVQKKIVFSSAMTNALYVEMKIASDIFFGLPRNWKILEN